MPSLQVTASSIPLSLASCSIGLPRHTLHQKLEAISLTGFQGIELSFPDLLAHARELQSLGQLPAGDIQDDDWPTLCKAAEHAHHLCATHGLKILVLQPFANFEGWTDSSARDAVFARAKGWAAIMKAAKTDMLQVGSTDTPSHKITSSKETLAADLAALADLLSSENPTFKIAYENWCWATHAPGWRDVWDIVQLAGRPNIGLCLDTFQSAGGEWGDPTTSSGRVQRQGLTEDALTAGWLDSLRDLVREVPPEKIFFLQISDAYKVQPPLAPHPEPNDDSGLRPRGRWSHDYRPLPYDGGYLPIADFTRAVLETGFRGWLSVEVFDGKFEDKYGDDLMRFAEKARDNTRRLVEEAAGMESL
ncbi:xylose isomerase-like protein [Cryphonectria parasitica EP155]|uniref:Xylose isomerase-like protein n=1 Tax=Cryphonectria parasitica (strain ATCC 38755 / EP155) TaxID=660469 RepID=A0A9P5CNN8_CRYP1|nr:xylose isomerase-like protein [Cryphonectria parasitica EP155]KAF3764120.1 xylose isomerase-like protein [Cryphonectria parasitica EP155]